MTSPPDLDLAALFRDFAPFVWRTVRRLGVADADADDVTQEVFLVVHRRLADFEARSSVRTWIFGICVRVASDHRRSAYQRRERPTDALPDEVGSTSPHHELEVSRARDQLDAALARLDDEKRAAFVLYELEELTLAEVAAALGCPLQTAYSRLQAARKHITAAFARADLPRSLP